MLGADIDPKNKSIIIWGKSELGSMLDINYSIKHLSINEHNLSDHRLSNTRKKAWQGSFGVSKKISTVS